MGNLINLRTARKKKARVNRELQAIENCKKFGRSKLVKNQQESKLLREKAHLDGHNLIAVLKPEQDKNSK